MALIKKFILFLVFPLFCALAFGQKESVNPGINDSYLMEMDFG